MRVRQHRPSWCLVAHKDGSYDVTRANRPVAHNLLSRSVALRYVLQRHQPGERVYEAEPDGYRTELTKQLAKSGKIMSEPQPDPHRPRRLRFRIN